MAAAFGIAQVATERLLTARRALEDIQRAHAAAHAAHGCKPGDPCPVCRRALPTGFSPPSAPGDEEARSELALAEEGSKSASNAQAAREQDLANAKRYKELARERVEGSSEELAEALNQLRARFGRGFFGRKRRDRARTARRRRVRGRCAAQEIGNPS